MPRPLAVLFVLLLQMLDVRAQRPQFEDRVGDAYEIRFESVSEEFRNGSLGDSRTNSTLVERVIALHAGGIELEFDLPEQASPQFRARTWQLPARVLKRPGHPLQLLNRSELETRVRAWLQRGRMSQAACGRWVFTWTATKIECDPESVLQMLEPYDLRLGDLRDGTRHKASGALRSAPLRKDSLDTGGATYAADLELDPDVIRRERAEADVALAQMTGKAPLALELALQARQAEGISGTIATTFEVDTSGRVTRRKWVKRVEVAGQAGWLERQTTTVIVERRLLSRYELRP